MIEEKDEIKKKAEEYERIRNAGRRNGKKFGKAIIFLPIAILLSSIAALMKKKPSGMRARPRPRLLHERYFPVYGIMMFRGLAPAAGDDDFAGDFDGDFG